MSIRILLLSLFIIFITNTSFASQLKKASYIPSGLSFKQGKEISYEYCPDNTCEVFMSAPKYRKTLEEITILYLYYFSGYIYLEKWREDVSSRTHIDKILAKHRNINSENKKYAAMQIITKSSKDINLKFYSVRYDEGKRNSVPINIERRLH